MKPYVKGFFLLLPATLVLLLVFIFPISLTIRFVIVCILLCLAIVYYAWCQANSQAQQKPFLGINILNEKYFRVLVEKSEAAIVLMDGSGKIFYQSPSTERIIGYSLSEIQGLTGLELIHPDDRTADAFMFEHLVKSPGDVMHRNHRLKHKNGQYRWMEGTLTNLLNDPDVNAIVYNYHDVTERTEAEEKSASAMRLYEFISRINQVIIHVQNEDNLFREACDIAVEQGKFRIAWIGMLDVSKNKLRLVTHAGLPAENLCSSSEDSLDNEELRNGIDNKAIQTGSFAFCNDLENEPEMDTWSKQAVERGIRSCISFPLKKFGTVIGVYTMVSSLVNCFDEKEIALLEEVASNISFTLENFEKEKQRLLAEDELAKVHKEKETTLNRIRDSVISIDNEWRYTFLNNAAVALHPGSREATLGQIIWNVHPGMIGTIFEEKYHEAMRTRKDVQVESYYSPFQTWFMAKIYPSEDGLTIFYQDITERKLVEEQIAMEKIFSDQIVNTLPGIFYMYDHTGKFIRWNRNFELISGYTREQVSNMHPLNFFEGEDAELIESKIKEVFLLGKAEIAASFCRADGVKIPYYFNGHKAEFNGKEYLMGMGIDITERLKTEKELNERSEEILQLTTHLEQIREEERTRISREIHDELGQQLTGLKMDVSWISKKLTGQEDAVREKISTMLSLIDETVKTVRRISSELRPGILDDLGLIPALEWQSQEFEKRTGIKTLISADLAEFVPDNQVATTIFRVYQEALTNIARHSNASLVELDFKKVENTLFLTVKDNGKGFDEMEIKAKNSLGLVGMRERARLINGELTIEKNQPEGTIIRLKIPLKPITN